jgi:Zn-dependent metalloprotease
MKNIFKHISKTISPPLFLLFGLLITCGLMAQDEIPLNPKLQGMAKPGSNREWINFLDNFSLDPTTIFTTYKTAFDLSGDDEMLIKKTNKDDIGFTHYKFDQTYKGHRVVYGEYIVHQQPGGIVRSANGRLITGIKAATVASVSEKLALDAALVYMKASKYLWQNADMEKELKRVQKDQKATYFPKGELVYAPNEEDNFNASNYRLAWSFKIYTDDLKVLPKQVYVDALTGKMLYTVDIAMNCSGGTGTSAFNGSVNISTELSGSVYRSHNNCQSTDIYVYNCNRGGASNTFYTDADNSWAQQSAVQAQWGAAQVYSYYNGEHNRQSWDGSGGDLVAYNNANIPDLGVNNACWGCAGNNGIFGAGSTTGATDDWNTDDIMGHEFTHGVTQDEAGLEYKNESGALNESFSDIFGEMVESWAEGNCDYLVGADRGAIRSFINPNSYGDPDTYKGTNWYTGTGDNGGVHTNSSVQNYWFYLLSEGGSGTNDKGESYNVQGITRFKARLIAYRALTQYLTSTSKYIDARKASLQAALDLYGQCSQEIIAVGDAWHAVGVESQSPVYTKNVCGTYPASGTFLQAISSLTAANGCTTTVTAGSAVYFTARDKVVLYPGFTATSGSNFTAYLEPCSSTSYLTTPKEIMSDAEKGLRSAVISMTNTAESALESKIALAVNENVSVAPNPFSGSFMLTINAKKDGKAQVVIYNSIGVKVQQQTGINLKKGMNKIPFNTPSLLQGTYMLEVNFGDSKIMKKIIKG